MKDRLLRKSKAFSLSSDEEKLIKETAGQSITNGEAKFIPNGQGGGTLLFSSGVLFNITDTEEAAFLAGIQHRQDTKPK